MSKFLEKKQKELDIRLKERQHKVEEWYKIEDLSLVIPKPKGFWWWKRCPLCASKLKKERWMPGSIWVKYECPKPTCGYQYVIMEEPD